MSGENGTMPTPTDLVSQRVAAEHISRSRTWIQDREHEGALKRHGKLYSLKEVAALSPQWPRRQRKKVVRKVPPPPPTKKKKSAMTSEANRVLAAQTRKATGVSQFAREEIRDFAKHIVVDTLHASSIIITALPDGTFDVLATPSTPAPLTFSV